MTRVILAAMVIAAAPTHANQSILGSQFVFSCAAFPSDLSEDTLVAKFGRANVKSAPVPWGGAEGDYTDGTILFEGVADRMVQIHWWDAAAKRNPDWVDIRGLPTRWKTPDGITVGTDLKTVERLNRRPFRMNAFGSDVGGAVMSWAGGRLAARDTGGCQIRFRFREASDGSKPGNYSQIARGDREVSSSHPAMQALNPMVWEMRLSYDRR